jgi:hypothetical protein
METIAEGSESSAIKHSVRAINRMILEKYAAVLA